MTLTPWPASARPAGDVVRRDTLHQIGHLRKVQEEQLGAVVDLIAGRDDVGQSAIPT